MGLHRQNRTGNAALLPLPRTPPKHLRIATLKYGRESKRNLPLDAALRLLLANDIAPKAKRVPGDEFRHGVLYTPEVDPVLAKHGDAVG